MRGLPFVFLRLTVQRVRRIRSRFGVQLDLFP